MHSIIKNVRVDHRLVHGQVAFTWTKFLGTDCILIVSDEVAKDELRSTALRMAKPSGMKMVIKSVEDSAKALNSGVTDKYKLLILFETIEDAYRLCQKTDMIKTVNLGGAKVADDKRQISKAVFVSEKDCERLKEMNAAGIKLEVQMLPDDEALDVMSLI